MRLGKVNYDTDDCISTDDKDIKEIEAFNILLSKITSHNNCDKKKDRRLTRDGQIQSLGTKKCEEESQNQDQYENLIDEISYILRFFMCI